MHRRVVKDRKYDPCYQTPVHNLKKLGNYVIKPFYLAAEVGRGGEISEEESSVGSFERDRYEFGRKKLTKIYSIDQADKINLLSVNFSKNLLQPDTKVGFGGSSSRFERKRNYSNVNNLGPGQYEDGRNYS